MALTTPTTVATNDILTASIWNLSVADNVTFLSNAPMASAYKTVNQSLATATYAVVTLADGEDYDTDSMHSLATNTGRFTATTAGKYRLSCMVAYDSNQVGYRGLRITRNGSVQQNGPLLPAFSGSGEVMRITHTGVVALTATQYLEVEAYQSSGGALNINAARVQVEWISQ